MSKPCDTNFVILIPARKGSKGVPFKNRKLLGYTLDSIPSEYHQYIYVSTDDEEIKRTCEQRNIKVHERNPIHATDTASIKQAVHEFIHKKRISKTVIMLYLTYPERTWDDVVKAYNFYKRHKATSLLCRKEISQHPYLMMKEKDGIFGEQIVKHNLYRRQEYPTCFEICHYVSIFEPWKFRELNSNMYNEKTIFFPIENKIDIDTEKDIEEFIEKNKLVLDKEVQQNIKIEIPLSLNATKEEWKPCTFENYIKGKNVIIVGPAENIKGKRLGVDIDSYDVVIRTNGAHAIIEKYAEDYGRRCDVLYTNHFFTFNVLNSVIHNMNPKPKFICYKGTCRSYENKTINDIIFRKWDLGVSSELTGMYIIKEIQKLGAKSITVAGMDFYQNKENVYNDAYLPKTFNYNYEKENRIHNYEKVRNEFNALVKNGDVLELIDSKIMSSKLPNKTKFAFCTAIDDSFINGFKTLLKSIKQFNPNYDYMFVVIDLGISNQNKKECVTLYKNIKFQKPEYENFKNINFKNTNINLVKSYYKLEAFNLSQFDKVLLLDSDMILNNSIDDLISMNVNIGAVPIYERSKDIINEKFINGGLFLIGKKYLNKKTYHALIKECEPGYSLAEQYPLTKYFEHDLSKLPKKFNVEKRMIESQLYKSYVYNSSIIHYVGDKPWFEKSETGYEHIDKFWKKYTDKKRIAIFVHIFYNDVWHKIDSYLQNINEDFDLYISTPRSNRSFVNDISKKYPNLFVKYIDNNVGADVGPFIELLNFAFYLDKNYDFILKLHTKKTTYVKNDYGVTWMNTLLEVLVGKNTINKILNLTLDDTIGIIGSDKYYTSLTQRDIRNGQPVNKKNMSILAKKLNINDNELNFFAGTMFWINFNILKKYLNNTLTINDFNEPHASDGTMAHAMERLFTCMSRDMNKKIIKI